MAYSIWFFLKCQEIKDAAQKLHDLTEELLGKQALSNLKEKNIWQGMPACLICCTHRGAPERIVQNVSGSDVNELWYFEGRDYRYAGETRTKYKFEIYVKNNFVTGWKNL